jgi:hypothetical protein
VKATSNAAIQCPIPVALRRILAFMLSPREKAPSCAGLGTAENLAWADFRLTSPLGDRVVVRDSDGSALPVRRR